MNAVNEEQETMPAWKRVWRAGLPHISTQALEALRDALLTGDKRILQGATTQPPPLRCVQDWPVEGACLWAYCGWVDLGPEATVAQVEAKFAALCYAVDAEIGEPAACRHLLNAYDEWPRDEMIRNMLPEINLALRERLQKGA